MRRLALLALVLACHATPQEAAAAREPPRTPAAADAASARGEVPIGPNVPADQLDTPGLRHVEVLRIDRDFGKPHFDIVLDAWLPRDRPDRLAEARLWWLKRHRADARGPFGKKSLRHVEVHTRRLGPGRIRLRIGGKGRLFAFEVVAEDGTARAYTRVRTADGRTVERCAATSAVLHAKKTLGIVTGIDRLAVRCTTPAGTTVTGEAVPDAGR